MSWQSQYRAKMVGARPGWHVLSTTCGHRNHVGWYTGDKGSAAGNALESGDTANDEMMPEIDTKQVHQVATYLRLPLNPPNQSQPTTIQRPYRNLTQRPLINHWRLAVEMKNVQRRITNRYSPVTENSQRTMS